jgi:hypothetical protein
MLPTTGGSGGGGLPRGRTPSAEFSPTSPVGDVRGYGVFDSRTSCGHLVVTRSALAETMKASARRVKMCGQDFFAGIRFHQEYRHSGCGRDPVGGVSSQEQSRNLDVPHALGAIVSIAWL